MKIIVAMTQVPFITGGADYHAQNLVNALKDAGHTVDMINIPMVDSPIELLENQIVATRLLEAERTWDGNSDLCIGLKFPAYYIKHSNKVIWALHQYRSAYELWGTEYVGMHTQPEGHRMKEIIINADNLYLKEAKRIYANSKNVANRMMKYNKIESEPLYHPCPDMDRFYCKNYDDYIFMPSRINLIKRQMLALEAMTHIKSKIKLIIVGKADHVMFSENVQHYIKKHGLESRVKIIEHVNREEMLELYANARAVLFIPFDEDYGYITLESMLSSKPVITTTDSGGPLEFIENNKTGLIADPNPVDLARVIDELASSETFAKEMGTAAKRYINGMNISWDNVIKELTK